MGCFWPPLPLETPAQPYKKSKKQKFLKKQNTRQAIHHFEVRRAALKEERCEIPRRGSERRGTKPGLEGSPYTVAFDPTS